MIKGFQRYKYEIILITLVCIYITYFTVASFLRYDNFYTGRFDLGNMDQTVWNTANGRIFQGSSGNGSTISRLSAHADFILILLAPLYFIWPHPKMLLLSQTIILALGAVFIYLIAKSILKNKKLALIFGFLFLMNPALQFTNLYDFHAVTLVTTTLLAAFYFLIKHKYIFMVTLLVLSGFTKEQIWIITSLFGLVLTFNKTKIAKFLGLGILFFSLATFGFLVWYAIPQNFGREHFALSYYSDFGNTPAEVIKNVIFSPHKLIAIALEPDRLNYLKQLFMPLGFIPFLSPLSLVFSIPDLLIGLLSSNPQLRQIYYHYTAAITPFIFIAAIFSVKNLDKWFPKINKNYLAVYLIATTLLSAYIYGPLPGAKSSNTDMFTKPQPNNKIIENLLSKIPEKHSVAATNNLGAHLSQRQKIATIPLGIESSDFILFLLNDKFAQPSLKAQKDLVKNLRVNINYLEIFRKDDFVVFKKIR